MGQSFFMSKLSGSARKRERKLPFLFPARNPMAEIIPDYAIYDFLISKGVEVEPPKSSKDLRERVIDGAITGLNPLVGAANMGLKQMGQGSKQQEWISWKQWTLAHEDWINFWEKRKSTYLKEEAKQQELRDEEESKQNARRAETHRVGMILLKSPLYVFGFLFAFTIVMQPIIWTVNYFQCGRLDCDSTSYLNSSSL